MQINIYSQHKMERMADKPLLLELLAITLKKIINAQKKVQTFLLTT